MGESDQELDSSSYVWLEDPGAGKGKKRRFSEEQVKSLELMFETQTKLEPRKKLQLSKDLGLHPRQVAIWFQNKRARWKSKQLEREYASLKADYDALLSSFDSLNNEKQALAKQLQKLAELLDKERGKEDERPSTVPSIERSDRTGLVMRSVDDEENRDHDSSRFREKEELGLCAEPAVNVEASTLVSSHEHQFFFQPSWPSDHVQPVTTTTASSQWWDFWPMNGS